MSLPHPYPPQQGLYHPANVHDACGVGFVAHIKGKKSHTIVEQGMTEESLGQMPPCSHNRVNKVKQKLQPHGAAHRA